MILIVNDSGVQLTSTLEEFRKFNETIVQFQYALDDAFRNKVFATEYEEDKEHFNILQDDFAHSLKYMDRGMVICREPGGIRFMLDREEYDKFQDALDYLRIDLTGFQNWHNSRGEHEKSDALDNLQDLIDNFIYLMGNKIIRDS